MLKVEDPLASRGENRWSISTAIDIIFQVLLFIRWQHRRSRRR